MPSPLRKSDYKSPRSGSGERLASAAAQMPNIAALAERFNEPLRMDRRAPARRAAMPKLVAGPSVEDPGRYREPGPEPEADRNVRKTSLGVPINVLVSGLVVLALVLLFVQLWPDVARRHPASSSTDVHKTADRLVAPPNKAAAPLEVALTSAERIEANTGDVTAFPIAIDATKALPVHSIVAITGLPAGASFSMGRPYGAGGWSLRPDEIADLELRLPGQSGMSDVELELVAGDGTVLSRSKTQLSITLPPVAVAPLETTESPTAESASDEQSGSIAALPPVAVAPLDTTESPTAESASDEQTGSIAALPPAPERKPAVSAGTDTEVKVNTVKLLPIEAPKPARRHDGAYALGAPNDTPAEWMETKTAVDMHAKAEQSSETVKVAQGGLKVRVVARDKNWIQVKDPKSSTTGWIYNRFLKPSEAPAK